MTARTQEDFLAAVGKFIDEIVVHELEMRDVTVQGGPVHNKRRQLARILFDEYMQNIPPAIIPQNISSDLVLMGNFITRCQVDLLHIDAAVREKALCTLRHLQYKISRLTCTCQTDMDSCQRLLILLRVIINNQNPAGSSCSTPNTHSGATTSQVSSTPSAQIAQTNAASTHPQSHNNNVPPCSNAQRNLSNEFSLLNISSAPNTNASQQNLSSQNASYTNVHRPKIYKWNIKFSNDKKSLGVFEFIQKVEAKAMAYEVTHEQLFQSACELFDGFAAKWFLTHTFCNWNELKEKLISDFVQVDYLENLLDTIRQRKQMHDEEIVHFFTVFENDCSRLRVQLSVEEKLNILKKNILQKYRPYVALSTFHSIDEMKNALKRLEISMSNDSKIVRFDSRDRNSYGSEYRARGNSNDRNRSRYDKFQSNTQYDRYGNRNRSSSNTSQHSGDANHSRTNFDRKPRQQTPNYRQNSGERQSDTRNRSGSRNSGRSQSYEKKQNLN